MGGINCPPPNGQKQNVSPELMERYVEQLARYTRGAFGLTSTFAEANRIIEDAVLGEGQVQSAASLLADLSTRATQTRYSLAGVAALRAEIGDDPSDYDAMFETMINIAPMAMLASQLLDQHTGYTGNTLQQRLWADERLTEKLNQLAQAMTDLMTWQVDFSKSAALIAA